jgi:hypothetical protein
MKQFECRTKDNRRHTIVFRNHLKSKIDQMEVDFENEQFWYDLNNFKDKNDPVLTGIA